MDARHIYFTPDGQLHVFTMSPVPPIAPMATFGEFAAAVVATLLLAMCLYGFFMTLLELRTLVRGLAREFMALPVALRPVVATLLVVAIVNGSSKPNSTSGSGSQTSSTVVSSGKQPGIGSTNSSSTAHNSSSTRPPLIAPPGLKTSPVSVTNLYRFPVILL